MQSIVRMATREALEEKKLGKTIYSFTFYQKIKRATIPIESENNNNDVGYVLLVSFDNAAEHEDIILNKILPLVNKQKRDHW